MDLGSKNSIGALPGNPGAAEDKTSYPNLSLNDDAAKAFTAEQPEVSVGDTFTGKVTIKVNSVRKDQFGHSIGFDVVSLDDVQAGAADGDEGDAADKAGDVETPQKAEGGQETDTPPVDEEEDEESKILGYKRPKKTPLKETPPVGGKLLES